MKESDRSASCSWLEPEIYFLLGNNDDVAGRQRDITDRAGFDRKKIGINALETPIPELSQDMRLLLVGEPGAASRLKNGLMDGGSQGSDRDDGVFGDYRPFRNRGQ